MTDIKTKAGWLEVNGFSQNGITYVVMGMSYPIKDALKEYGFKFSPLLRWHCGDCDFELPENCFYKELEFDTYFVWDENAKVVLMREGARDAIEKIFNPPEDNSTSRYVGEIGERLRDIEVKVIKISGFDSAYGYKWVYTFADESGNRFTWFTTSQQSCGLGDYRVLTGTVKVHAEYKGVPTTQLTRCILKSL